MVRSSFRSIPSASDRPSPPRASYLAASATAWPHVSLAHATCVRPHVDPARPALGTHGLECSRRRRRPVVKAKLSLIPANPMGGSQPNGRGEHGFGAQRLRKAAPGEADMAALWPVQLDAPAIERPIKRHLLRAY